MKGIFSLILIAIGSAVFALGKIELPPGFSFALYAGNVAGARSLALTPNGTLFVGSMAEGKVYAILDRDGDRRADQVIVVADQLFLPNGVAFQDGALYVATVNKILKYPDIEARLANPPAPEIVYDKLPSDVHHGWKFIRFGPDGKLYVPIGAPCNICDRGDPYAAIARLNTDGTSFEIYARGIRNTVGFDWHPETNDLWFTDNGRDMLGDNIPPDELNRAPRPGLHFGYPYIHGKDILDPEFGKKGRPLNFTPPAQELGPHVASLGMRFYTGKMFPPEYHGQIFIAEHGSWNRSQPIGYRVTLVKLDKNGRPIAYQPFAKGWLKGTQAWGRPVDIEIMDDGSMLVSDDKAGAVYRISYQGGE
ncbi:MAG: PQQ-dependent sugar dehydrogenase [Candidatus Margulisiibacteriota bacterium]|jgi:glucose/arabinose dehydrogenase